MARILLTSGPTREYLDPVRYLTNASSGRMGAALAAAALEAGHTVTIVSGPVDIDYPAAARVVPVISTSDMLRAATVEYAQCDGLIAVAAPCDYRPRQTQPHKISKSGQPLTLELDETPDIVASLAAGRQHQWTVAFALETADQHLRAMQKLARKNCDLIVLNGPTAIDSAETSVEVLDRQGAVVLSATGPKTLVASALFQLIAQRLIDRRR